MTLSTYIYVHGRVSMPELFTACQSALTDHDGPDFRGPAAQRWEDDKLGGDACRMNKPGQDLPAWLLLYHNVDVPLVADAAAHDQYCDADCDGGSHDPAHWLRVNFDTAYGYRGAGGMGCGTLHAILVAVIGKWLDARGVAWSWRNEFTGEVHQRYDGLRELADGGEAANKWFETMVKPAIARMLTP